MKKILLFFTIFLILFSSSYAQNTKVENNFPQKNYPKDSAKIYNWKVIRVVDGDTLEIANEFLPAELKLFVRIKGIDSPEKESRAKCQKERVLAQKASDFTSKTIVNAQKNRHPINFSEIKWDKYGGRIVAKVMINNVDLGQQLVSKGLARVYNGDKKKSWCNGN